MSKFPATGKFAADGQIDLGFNGTTFLAKNKNAYISIAMPRLTGDWISKGFLRFKAFVTNFSRSSETEYTEDTFAVAQSPRAIKGPITNQINLQFEVPSQTYNEARVNFTKINSLCRFFLNSRKKYNTTDKKWEDTHDMKKFTHNPDYFTTYILFSNFIHNIEYGVAEDFNAETYDEVVERGQKSIITDFSFEFDVEGGFFEGDSQVSSLDEGKLFPKNLKVSLSITPIVEQLYAGTNKITPFSGYNTGDEPVNYPFGIDYRK